MILISTFIQVRNTVSQCIISWSSVHNSDTQLWSKVTCRLSAGGPSFLRVTHGERNRDHYANQHSLAQILALSTIKRKIRDCLHFSTVAAYSFWSENVNDCIQFNLRPSSFFSFYASVNSSSALHPPPPCLPRAEPPGINIFVCLGWQIPGGGDSWAVKFPGVGTRKEGKCPILHQHHNIFHWFHSQIMPF